MLPRQMRGIVANEGRLEVVTRPVPEPQPDEVLIEVAAAGLNGADLSQRKGKYPPPADASDILGLEVSGTVMAVGADVTEFTRGDRVCALLTGGGYAEYCAVPEGQVVPLPEVFGLGEGAAILETLTTVWANVFEDGRLKKNESFLVHGGSSGIGTTAIQLAHAWGSRVFATAGTPEKVAFCNELGARGINYRDDDFVEIVKSETDGGVDVILDIVGGSYLARNVASLAIGGRLAVIALAGGRMGELDLGRLMMKRLQITGSTLRARPAAEKARLIREMKRTVWPLIEQGRFKPVIDSTFALGEAAAAHERMEKSEHIGKIVLVVR